MLALVCIQEPGYVEGGELNRVFSIKYTVCNDFPAERTEGQARRSVSGGQEHTVQARDLAEYGKVILSQWSQADADLFDFCIGEARCDAQGFCQRFAHALDRWIRREA